MILLQDWALTRIKFVDDTEGLITKAFPRSKWLASIIRWLYETLKNSKVKVKFSCSKFNFKLFQILIKFNKNKV